MRSDSPSLASLCTHLQFLACPRQSIRVCLFGRQLESVLEVVLFCQLLRETEYLLLLQEIRQINSGREKLLDLLAKGQPTIIIKNGLLTPD